MEIVVAQALALLLLNNVGMCQAKHIRMKTQPFLKTYL